MADIQYLNYGDLQVELLALLNNLADNVQSYVAKLSWSNKRKLKFMSAYSDLINRGILGASNTTGQWMIDVKGDDINYKDQKDKEMYLEAAYFIQLLMAGLPTKASLDEEKKKLEEEEKKKAELEKSKLPVFDNKTFTSSFINHISTSKFGGQDFHIGGEHDNWNKLDKRDSNGIRGKQNRIDTLKNYLISYRDKFDDSKYNFEGSPFENALDFRKRLDDAINALTTPDKDDDEQALNKLGLNPADWFNNGSGDPSDTINPETNLPFTYAELAKYNLDLAKLKAKLEAEANKKKLIQQLANRFNYAVRSSIKMVGQNPQVLALKYKNDQGILNQLSLYAQSGNITPEQWSEILGAYKFYNSKGVLLNLSKLELDSFNGLRGYNGLGPGVLKKLPGVDGLYFDTRTELVIKAGRREQQALQPILGLLELNNPEYLLQQYMNSTEGGFTLAEQREVAALLFDLGAAVDPEGFTSAGLSQIAAGIRDYNRASDPNGWTWGDTGWATLDHGLGLLSAIPFVGGLIKGSWAASKLANYLPKMERTIRYLGRAGSTYAMASNAPGALNTLNKIKNGEDLSLKDYQDLAYFFIGGLGHHLLNRGNRVERSAMKARGIETSNSVLNKMGVTRTTAKSGTTTQTKPTLKVKKTGEDGKVETKQIPIEESQLKILKGTKPEELDAKVKELNIDVPEGYKVDVPTSNWRSSKYNEFKSKYLGKGNKEIFGTQTSQKEASALKSDEEFEQYLSEYNNTWLKKFINGSNRDIRRYDRYLGNNNLSSQESSKKSKKEQLENLLMLALPNKNPLVKNSPLNIRKDIEISNNYRNIDLNSRQIIESFLLSYGLGGLKSTPIRDGFGGNAVKAGKYESDLLNITLSKNKAKELRTNPGKLANWRGENARKVQSLITSKKATNKEIVEIIKALKKKGFLKQGGTIDKQRIQKYKEFIKK